MSSGDLSPFGSPIDEVATVSLERARMRIRGRIGPAVQQTMRLDARQDVVDGLVLQLSAELLRRRVGEGPDTAVDWHSTVHVAVPTTAPRPPRGWQFVAVAGALLAVVAILLGSSVAGGGGVAIAIAALMLRLLNPPGQPGVHEVGVPVAGVVRVTDLTLWQTFPHNMIEFPPELGRPIEVVVSRVEADIRQQPEGT
jgi:hypothetical protein